MASTVISPRPVEACSPAASLQREQLDQLCSGNLDAFIEEASRLSLSREPSSSAPRSNAGKGKPAAARKQVAPRSLSLSSLSSLDPARLAKLRAANAIVRNCWQYKSTGSVKAASVLAELKTKRLPTGGPAGLAAQAAALIQAHGLDDTTYLYDLGNTTRLFKAWRGALPRVHPFYAIKCNPEPALLKLLAALGAGFDCASRAELQAVLALGVPKERIIFAHPCKRASDLRFARDAGIQTTTFDTESELAKVAAAYPGIQLVLRVRCDDPEAKVPLGLKYGCDPGEAGRLLAAAAGLGLAVVGVSFHVGSGCRNLAAYDSAIATARAIFDQGEAHGHVMSLLDIGGGFTGRFDAHGHVQFGDIARTINAAIGTHFPPASGVRIISEPGRYFAEASAALIVPVYGKRDRPGSAAGAGPHKDYWLTDGLYGSFNCILYDDQRPQPIVLRSPLLPPIDDGPPAPGAAKPGGAEGGGDGAEGGAGAPGAGPRLYESTLWGPTCDSADFLYKDVRLPELRNGDWLLFTNTGAYTVAGACDFNGIAMTSPHTHYVFSACAVDEPEAGSESEANEADESGCEGGEDSGLDSGDEDEAEGEPGEDEPLAQ